MHVLSTAQLERILDSSNRAAQQLGQPALPANRAGALLDVGAGDGHVTAQLAALPHVDRNRIVVTEVSCVMAWRLRRRGYRCVRTDNLDDIDGSGGDCMRHLEAGQTRRHFELVSCLNVLDRCDRPRYLLHQLRSRLRPGSGRLLLALVVPYRPMVETRTFPAHRRRTGAARLTHTTGGPVRGSSRPPHERLHIGGRTWEAQCAAFIQHELLPLGFRVLACTRVPYLCEGDYCRPYYELDDAVVVLSLDRSDQRPAP